MVEYIASTKVDIAVKRETGSEPNDKENIPDDDIETDQEISMNLQDM